MEPGSLTLLAKVGAPAASRLGTAGFKKISRRFRLARRISKDAHNVGIVVSSRTLRKWLSRADTDIQLRECSEASLTAAADRLAFLIPGTTREARIANARKVVALIYAHHLKDLDASAALELATHWQLTAIVSEAESGRETTRAAKEEVLARLDDGREFERNLAKFSGWRQAEAMTLRDSWPSIERVVSIISEASIERGEILSSWSTAPPTWLSEAPWKAYAYLANLSSDYEQHKASFHFAMRAVEEGAHPRGYWVARAVMQMRAYDEEGAKRLCAESSETHPLLETQRAIFSEDPDAMIEHLDNWNTDSPQDSAIKAQLRALAWNTKGDLSKAIGLLEEEFASTSAAGVGELAARLLLMRATGRHTETRLRDAQKSLSLSLQARNSRRQWHGDSVSPLIIAIQAAIISGDAEKAWHLTQPMPEGDATPSESSDTEVISASTLVAAITGRFEAAERLLGGASQGFEAAHVKALIAEAKSEDVTRNPEVQALWQAAWDAAEYDQDRLLAAMGIAEAGGTLPDLSALENSNSEAVQEIRDISRALASPGDATVSLRANAHKSRIVTVKLAQRLYSHGDVTGAADALLAGSVRWRDAQLAAMAAVRYQEAGLPEKAREAAQSALSQGGTEWAGAGRMYGLLIEVESANGNVDAAASAARNLLSLDENDEDARWALVRCLMLRSDMDAAWHALQHRGEPVYPRNQNEAIIWINLNARFSVDPRLAGKALQLMKRWPDDERLLGVFIGVMLTGFKREEVRVSDSDSEMLQSALDNFLTRFPESNVFGAVEIQDASNPLASLADRMRDEHERLREVRKMASSGVLPIGLIGEAVGRSYTETSLLQATGFVYAQFDPDPGGDNSLSDGLPERVVLDVTAAHTLALLDEVTADQLVGRIVDLVTTDAFYRDSMGAYEALSLQSEMTLLWNEDTGAPSVHLRSAEDMDRLIRDAQRIFQIVGSSRRIPWLELRNFSELSGKTAAEWLTGLDCAKSQQAAFWSDDRVLRSVGREKGVQCFSTLDLVRFLQRAKMIKLEEKEAIEGLLIRHHYVDIPFSARTFELAAAGDGWRARGATYSLTRPQFWRQPEAVIGAVLHAIEQVWRVDPSEITGWISSAGIGLVRVAGDAEAASRNLAVFLRKIIARSWLETSTVPYVLKGIRGALEEVPGASDPIQTVFGEVYGALVGRFGHVTAANYLMGLFAIADSDDKAIASRVVLMHK
ncbi:hypothetical protein [Streptomyces sp. CdTB01]|uniref:tetratricopeptide repeat protein n=1 Tax=Streptomyces sp. CdTB01 TaxID=1725411 RepID=UPI000A7B8AEA|nr:hypothetical protein [Streptomyces sp. CdTB01]